MRRSRTTIVAGFAALLAVAIAVPSFAEDKNTTDPKLTFEKYTLDNGLEVILHQDNRVPLVAVDVWYHVAAGDEVPGKTGFAHLFEHMLFQGSKNVGSDRHFEVLKGIGSSTVNGSTNNDRTNYFEVVPSNQLETALWLESDRMGYLLPLLTKKSLDNQIEVVRNERRQSYDNRPYGKSRLKLFATLYPADHPYHGSVIGKHEDLANATLADVVAFYKKWYVPANATLVIAGDFDNAEAKKLVDKWFATFPKSIKPERKVIPAPVITRTRATVEDRLAKMPSITYAWHTPAFFTKGDGEMDIIASALGASGTGRLYKILVHEKQLAQRVSVYQSSMNFSSAFIVSVIAKPGANLDEIEKIINEEIEGVRTQSISDREFKRALVGTESRFIWGLESLMARAELLQRYNHYVGKPDYITEDLDRYRNTTPEIVRTFAEKYLGADKRVEIITMPAKTETATLQTPSVSKGAN